jgi:hypothetical protein
MEDRKFSLRNGVLEKILEYVGSLELTEDNYVVLKGGTARDREELVGLLQPKLMVWVYTVSQYPRGDGEVPIYLT